MSTSHPLKSFEQKLHFNKFVFEDLNKVYIQSSQDLALSPMTTRAKNMGLTCYEINTGHFPMITYPETLIDLLLEQSKN